MILLDTNVISELMKRSPHPGVVAWLDRQPRTSVWTTSVTIFEIRFGITILPAGKRREELMESFKIAVLSKMARRVAVFDTAAAQATAELMSSRQRAGRAVELKDAMIAGIALAANASVATGNSKHFDDLRVTVINPWTVN